MKTFHQHAVNRRTLTGYALFGLLALASPVLLAQTFAGRDFLIETPASFRAIIKASTRQEAITIHLENQSSGGVHIQISNQVQQPVYDDYVTKPGYFARLDVSALPYGMYTVALSSRTARQTQPFLIERSAIRRGALVTLITKPDSLFNANTLAANKLR